MSIPNRIALLNSDGTTDTTFSPSFGLNAAGRWVNALPNGSILVGGDFTQYDGAPRAHIAAVDIQGNVLSPVNANNVSRAGAAQTDGKDIVGGDFTAVAGVSRNRVTRIQSDLTVEDAYNPNANGSVYAVANQGDGKTVVAGSFSQVGGVTRNNVARLYNDETESNLLVIADHLIQWLRGGALQATQTLVFAVSTDGGATYTDVPGTVTAIAGGWEFAPTTPLSTSGKLRARAYTTDSHSEGIQETIVDFNIDPDIEVVADGVILENNVSTVSFDSIQLGTTKAKVFTIRNVGLSNLTLTGSNPVQLSGTNANQWTLSAQPSSPITPGQSVTFQLLFNPTSAGSKTALVTIHNGDPDENPFTFNLSGVVTPGPGSLDSTWQPVANNGVLALATDASNNAHVAGEFTSLNAVSVGRYAKLNSDAIIQPKGGSGANGAVLCEALLPSGQLLIGGAFTTIHGVSRPRLARLNADGTLDSSFSIAVNGEVRNLAVTFDGRAYVSGAFTTIAGRTTGLARLTSSGTYDTTFASAVTTGFDGSINCVAIQTDGKVLVSGYLYIPGTSAAHTLVRLNEDGSIDNTFTPVDVVNFIKGKAIAIQADGKIVLSLDDTSNALKRFSNVGVLDATFTPTSGTTSAINSLVTTTEGKLMVARKSSTSSFIRLQGSNGATDTTFVASATNPVNGIAIQTDGKVLLGGYSMSFAGSSPRNLARLIVESTLASSSLSVVSASQVQWLRSGTLPETTQVMFRYYPTDSTIPVLLGRGVRINGGWELSGISLPISGTLSAYAAIPCGLDNGSSSLIEQTIPFSNLDAPDLSVEYPVGTTILNGGSVNFPGTLPGQFSDLVFTLRNTGNATLNNIAASAVGEWSVISSPATTLAPGGTTPMTVRFAPTGTNQRGQSNLTITSSVPGIKNPYIVRMFGNGVGLPTCSTGGNTSAGVGARNLTGTFKANHDTAVAYFQYRLASSTTWLNSPTQNTSGFSNVNITIPITGLTVGQSYVYRAAIYNAVNANSPTFGGTSSFTP